MIRDSSPEREVKDPTKDQMATSGDGVSQSNLENNHPESKENKTKVVHQLQFRSFPPVEINAAIPLPAVFKAKEQQEPVEEIVEDNSEVAT